MFKPVYAIIGDDDASKDARIKALKGAFEETLGTNNIEIYDAAITQPSYLLMNLTSMSLFGGGRLVILRNFDAWGEGVKKTPTPTDDELRDLTEYMSDPQKDTILILSGIRFPKKLVIWKDLYRAVESAGKILEYNLPKDWEMGAWTVNTAQELGLSISKTDADYLVDLVGKDSLNLKNELVKMGTYLNTEKRIDRKTIDELVARRPRSAEFKMLEALSEGNYSTVFSLLNESIESRVPIHRMVYPIMKEFRMLIAVKDIVDNNGRDTDIEKMLMDQGFFKMKPSPWVIKQLKKKAERYTREQLVKSIWTVGTLDYELKGGLSVKRPFQLSYEMAFYNVINNGKNKDLYL